ncbi:MAG: hypothetical protein J6T10_11105 [Methanobrevibacter sp.]|nr:hypothetical protein [Methanobrevibacter sp.]
MAGAGYKHLEIVQDFEKYVKDKKTSSRAYYRYLLSRLLRMFQYKNLPDTIPHEILDRYLFEYGIACITEVEGNLYVFSGNLGGPQDVYYRPTEFIISNPHIKKDGEIFSANVPVYKTNVKDSVSQPIEKVDGILMRNDLDWVGLHPLLSRYAYLMAENVLTLRTADVMLRIIALLTAKTDAERAASIEYLKSIEKGELGVIGESAFHEGVEMQSPPSNNGSYLTQFIEYQQYLKGSFYNEIGLSANYNMKREAIGKGESTLDEDALLPLCDNMLTCRREDLAKVNAMFGTDISVEFSSSWLENRIEALSALRDMSSGISGSGPFGQPTGIPQPVPSNETSEEVGQPSEPAGEGKIDSNSVIEPSSMGQVGSTEGQSTNIDETMVTEEGNEGSEGSDSEINDLSQDKELTELLDKANEEPEMQMQMQLVDQEGKEKSDEDDATGSEDEGNTSTD